MVFAQPAGVFGVPNMLVCFGLVLFGAWVAFLYSQRRCLARCEPANRAMDPGWVWLNLIPGFNVVWQYVTIHRVADSLRREFVARGRHQPGDSYGRTPGMILYGIAAVGFGVAALVSFVPPLKPLMDLVLLAALVCFVLYQVRMNGYSHRLGAGRRGDGGGRPPRPTRG